MKKINADTKLFSDVLGDKDGLYTVIITFEGNIELVFETDVKPLEFEEVYRLSKRAVKLLGDKDHLYYFKKKRVVSYIVIPASEFEEENANALKALKGEL